MKTENIILHEFKKNIANEGLFWRISRPNTFVDLLMLESYKASKSGLNHNIATNVIIIALKAIINDRYGVIDYKLDFEEINKQVLHEEEQIVKDVGNLLGNFSSTQNKGSRQSLHEELDYFKVLNELKIDNYSTKIFENILEVFLSYMDR